MQNQPQNMTTVLKTVASSGLQNEILTDLEQEDPDDKRAEMILQGKMDNINYETKKTDS